MNRYTKRSTVVNILAVPVQNAKTVIIYLIRSAGSIRIQLIANSILIVYLINVLSVKVATPLYN